MPNINGMTIDELGSVSAITANDEVPVWDAEAGASEPTKKVTGSDLASSVKTLGSLLGTSDVVNNLTSTATDKPLSAAQGKALNDKLPIKEQKNTPNTTFSADETKILTVATGYTGKTLLSAIVSGEYPSGTREKLMLLSAYISGDTLYAVIKNIASSTTGVLQLDIFLQP